MKKYFLVVTLFFSLLFFSNKAFAEFTVYVFSNQSTANSITLGLRDKFASTPPKKHYVAVFKDKIAPFGVIGWKEVSVSKDKTLFTTFNNLEPNTRYVFSVSDDGSGVGLENGQNMGVVITTKGASGTQNSDPKFTTTQNSDPKFTTTQNSDPKFTTTPQGKDGNITQGLDIINPIGSNSLEDFIAKALSLVVAIGTPLVAFFIIFTGFMFVAAQGNEEKLKTAKRSLLYTLIGAILILGCWGLAQAIKGTVEDIAPETKQMVK